MHGMIIVVLVKLAGSEVQNCNDKIYKVAVIKSLILSQLSHTVDCRGDGYEVFPFSLPTALKWWLNHFYKQFYIHLL